MDQFEHWEYVEWTAESMSIPFVDVEEVANWIETIYEKHGLVFDDPTDHYSVDHWVRLWDSGTDNIYV